jgi:RNA polymerase sigma-70 factor, ECF subfamily
MEEIYTTVEELEIREEPQRYTVLNKEAVMFDSSMGKYPKDIAIPNLKGLPDEELAGRFVKDRNEEAFNELVNRYGDKVYRTALRITHNHSDAEDVLQDVFIKLIKNLYTFRGKSKFSSWLYRVAVNSSFMHLRTEKKKYENKMSLEDYVSYNEDGTLIGIEAKDWSDRPDEVLLSKEIVEMIESAMSELPELCRIAIHLRDVEGLTNYETAKVLGISVSAAKSRIHRARLFLRDKLSDYFSMDGKIIRNLTQKESLEDY